MTTFDAAALSAEFPRAAVSWRSQSLTKDGTKALALAYIDARDVMDRLDTVCGPQNWQDKYEFHGSRTVCYLSIRIGDEWITKADGAGDSDVEAEKGAISDALKRAAVKWGIGRYLYALSSPWVPCDSYEKGGKFYWSKWTADPWSCIRGLPPQSIASTDSEAAAAAADQPSVADFIARIDGADSLVTLQSVFKEAWKAHPGPNSRTSLQNRYEARKAALTPVAANLGQHLDNLQAQEKARNAIPN